MDSIAKLISSIGQKAKNASNTLRVASTDTKNSALLNIANDLILLVKFKRIKILFLMQTTKI